MDKHNISRSQAGQNTDQGLLNETVSMAKEALDTEVISFGISGQYLGLAALVKLL